MASKKLRFEVFKRDGFTCQYCGRTPPVVILEIDHVMPKSKGGPNDVNNYLTACYDCNRGKGNRELTEIPSALKENLIVTKEKRQQIKAYNNFLMTLAREETQSIQTIENIFIEYFPNYCMTDKVEDAMRMACSKFSSIGEDSETNSRSIKYFCGICYNWIKRPETRTW
jgi:hypothetical protein